MPVGAREYLAKVVPWPQNGSDGFINIHWTIPPRNNGGKPYWTGRAVRDVNDAVRTIEWAKSLPDTRDMYVCMSRQAHAIERTSKTGHKYLAPARSGENALELKSLFIDIDVKGGDNGYASQEEALRELGRFIKEVSLPKPSTIVISGGGLHIYWTLAQALAPNDWKPLALALAEAGFRHGLKFDSGCTVDGARVLRVPDTLNYKSDPPKPVSAAYVLDFDYALDRIAKALEPYKTAVPVREQSNLPQISAALLTKFAGFTDNLSDGILKIEHPPIKLDSIAKECAFVRDAIVTGGLAYDQPKWNLTTLISTFTDGSRADAHRMAAQHPGYTKESTDDLYDRKEREKAQKGLGWPSCAAIAQAGCKACQSCKHFTKGKTPLHTALAAIAPVVSAAPVGGAGAGPVTSQVNDLPSGYARDAKGIILGPIFKKDGTSDMVPVCEYSLEDPMLQTNPDILNFVSKIELGQPRKIHIPLESIAGMDGRAFLAKQGFLIPVGAGGPERVWKFMHSWIKHLRETRASVFSAPFGWSYKGPARNGFVYGGQLWTPTGATPAALADPTLRAQYDPAGDLTPWIIAARLITDQKRPSLDAIVASAFGAPLIEFSGEAGAIISCEGKSGIGKTTAMKVAMAVWGHPTLAMEGLDDTTNYGLGKLTKLRSLPLYWDEIKTDGQRRKVVDLTFNTTSGKGKGRMGRSANLKEPGMWKTLFIIANNDSLLDHIKTFVQTSNAGLYRVYEFLVKPGTIGQIRPGDASALIDQLQHNYGCAGVKYSEFLGANHHKLAAEFLQMRNDLDKEFSGRSDERFWMVSITALLLGARYANQLRLTAIDEKALKTFLFATLNSLRTSLGSQPTDLSIEVNVSNIMARYFEWAKRNYAFVYTNKIHTGRGKPLANSIRIDTKFCDPTKLTGAWVQKGLEDNLIRIADGPLVTWLRSVHISPTVVVRALKDDYKARCFQARMASGTRVPTPVQYLFEIKLSDAPNLDDY